MSFTFESVSKMVLSSDNLEDKIRNTLIQFKDKLSYFKRLFERKIIKFSSIYSLIKLSLIYGMPLFLIYKIVFFFSEFMLLFGLMKKIVEWLFSVVNFNSTFPFSRREERVIKYLLKYSWLFPLGGLYCYNYS